MRVTDSARRWICAAEPKAHGTFLHSALIELSDQYPTMFMRDTGLAKRLACPMCLSTGGDGWLRPTRPDDPVTTLRIATVFTTQPAALAAE